MANVVVYCSSQPVVDKGVMDCGIISGKVIGEEGCTLVYGGVDAGLMHVVAENAKLSGAEIVGVVPERFKHRLDNLVSKPIFTSDLSSRKDKMISLGDIFIVLPGGIGTIDEWISTLSQLKVSADNCRQIIIVNLNGMFDAQIEQLRATAESPYSASSEFLNCQTIVTDSKSLEKYLRETISKFK